jgi:putative ABC transport system permease protein
VRDAVQQTDSEVPVRDVTGMDEFLAQTLSQRRFNMLLLAAFAGLALVLAAVGIYSVLSYAVRRRTREIGIRVALGASVSHVTRMIVMDGLRPTLTGLCIGLSGALLLGKVVAHLIYGVKAYDPATLGAVSLLLVMVAIIACAIPAYRASRIDPMAALRDE